MCRLDVFPLPDRTYSLLRSVPHVTVQEGLKIKLIRDPNRIIRQNGFIFASYGPTCRSTANPYSVPSPRIPPSLLPPSPPLLSALRPSV